MARAEENGRESRRRGERRRPAPLTRSALDELALRYVSRFATTRAKLIAYLQRKLRERGWTADEPDPDLPALAERFAELGYVDDAAFAVAKASSLTRRGYGPRRVTQALQQAGVDDDDAAAARDVFASAAVEAALRFARRRRLGPWAAERADPRSAERALAAMIRAGHDFRLSRAILQVAPGSNPCPDTLAEYVIIKVP